MDDKTKELVASGACEASIDDLERGMLEHYERISLEAHEWNNQVPQAIKAWYAAKRLGCTVESSNAAGVREGMERAAKLCDEQIFGSRTTADLWLRGANDACFRLAYLIRSLAGATNAAGKTGVGVKRPDDSKDARGIADTEASNPAAPQQGSK